MQVCLDSNTRLLKSVFAHFSWNVSFTEGDYPCPVLYWGHGFDQMSIQVGITSVVFDLLRIKTCLH